MDIVFLLKVVGLATLLSLSIKYLAPTLAITPSAGLSIVIILLPASIMAVILVWQWQRLQE